MHFHLISFFPFSNSHLIHEPDHLIIQVSSSHSRSTLFGSTKVSGISSGLSPCCRVWKESNVWTAAWVSRLVQALATFSCTFLRTQKPFDFMKGFFWDTRKVWVLFFSKCLISFVLAEMCNFWVENQYFIFSTPALLSSIIMRIFVPS